MPGPIYRVQGTGYNSDIGFGLSIIQNTDHGSIEKTNKVPQGAYAILVLNHSYPGGKAASWIRRAAPYSVQVVGLNPALVSPAKTSRGQRLDFCRYSPVAKVPWRAISWVIWIHLSNNNRN